MPVIPPLKPLLPFRAYPPGDRDRHLGEHVPAYAVQGRGYLVGISILLGVSVGVQIVMQNWEIGAAFAAILDLNLLAAHYARRAECPHGLARAICAIYFSTLRDPDTHRAFRRYVRLPILALFGLLLLLASQIRFPVGHHRPPLIDPRIFSTSGNWDYLREHHFFRDPPPAATPPENR